MRASTLVKTGPGGRRSAVHVLYGGRDGLGTTQTLFRQGASGVFGAPETGDQFGAALASGDFDTDGYADLAVGAPSEDVAGA